MNGSEPFKTHVQAFAEKYNLPCDVSEAEGRLHCIIRKVGLKAGVYSLTETPLLLVADQQYPISAMDMFWVDEGLTMADGTVVPASEEITVIMGKRWRRFSRHRGPQSPQWNPNANGIEQQFLIASSALELNDE